MNEGWKLERGAYLPAALPLPAGVAAGFTTREAGDFNEAKAAAELCGRLGATRLRLLHQVHGVELLPPDEPGEKPEADGWAGKLPVGALLAVKAADCLPVLVWSERGDSGAAAHAGWRGAVAGIAGKAVKALGVGPESLCAALGPCICRECFEVGPEVAAAAGSDPRWLASGKPGKFHFDLAAYVEGDLLRAGIAPRRILKLGLCTKCNPELFWSYRGGDEKHRMIGYLGMIG